MICLNETDKLFFNETLLLMLAINLKNREPSSEQWAKKFMADNGVVDADGAQRLLVVRTMRMLDRLK